MAKYKLVPKKAGQKTTGRKFQTVKQQPRRTRGTKLV